jgi:hypothetical protein
MKNYFLFIAILVISIIAIFSCRKSIESEVKQARLLILPMKRNLKFNPSLTGCTVI